MLKLEAYFETIMFAHTFMKHLIFLGIFYQGISYALNPNFILFHYAVESISPTISNKECQELYKTPYEYTFLESPDLQFNSVNPVKLTNFKLLNKALISKNEYLLSLHFNADFILHAEPKQNSETMDYLMDMHSRNFKGSFILHDFCKGQILGMEVK